MELNPGIRAEFLANAPSLWRFALSLCGTTDGAYDLVQETLLLVLTHLDSFQSVTIWRHADDNLAQPISLAVS
jgi:DNA-directed RNA polymerase specialized sigma24 family protein